MKVYNNFLHTKMDLVGEYSTPDIDQGIYSDMLPVMAKRFKERLDDQYQNVIVITGGTGSGKSNLAINLARMLDPHWDLEENIIYSAADMAVKLDHLETASPISLYDEGSVVLNALNFNRKEDRDFMDLFDSMRSLGWTSILCLPNLKNLNGSLKATHMDYHFICPDKPLVEGYDRRGFFETYVPHTYQWTNKVYNLNCGAGVFSKIPRSVDTVYQDIKRRKQVKIIKKFVKTYKPKTKPEEDTE